MTLWVTFTPCFLWIFAGAPYLEWIGTRPRLAAALSAITAAVVGVILNLSVWFAVHVFFSESHVVRFGSVSVLWPNITTLNLSAVCLAGLSAILLFRYHFGLPAALAIAAMGGAALSVLG